MYEIKLNTRTIQLADDIDELSIKRFNLLNEFSMQDFEIGNDMAAVDRHEQRIEMMMVNKKYTEAITVQKNKRMTYYAMLNKINYKSLMFACHINTIDGKPLPDYLPQNLLNLMDQLSDDGLTIGMVQRTLVVLKKKLKSN